MRDAEKFVSLLAMIFLSTNASTNVWAAGTGNSQVDNALNQASQQAKAASSGGFIYGSGGQGQQAQGPFVFESYVLGQNQQPEAQLNVCMSQANNVSTPNTSTSTGSFADMISSAGQAGGQLASSIGAAAAGGSSPVAAGISGGASGLNSDQNCDGPLAMPEGGNSCSDFQFNGKFSASELKASLSKLEKFQKQAACQHRQAQQASILSGCFSDYFKSLKDDMQKLQSVFSKNKDKFEGYVSKLDARIEKEDSRLEQIDGKLQSLSATKGKLEAAKASLNGVTGGAGNTNIKSVAGLEQRVREWKNEQEKYNIFERSVLMNSAASCMTSGGKDSSAGAPDSQFAQCQASATENYPVTACMADLYRRQVIDGLRSGGREDNSMKKKADVAKQEFQAAMNRIVGELKSSNPRYDDVDQLLATRGAELSRFGAWRGYFETEVKKCFADSKRKKDQGYFTELTGAQKSIEETGRVVSSEIGAVVSSLDSIVRDGIKELFQSEANTAFNSSNCLGSTNISNSGQTTYSVSDVSTQLKCVKDLRAVVTQMLDGTGGATNLPPVQVPLGITDSNNQQVTCQNIRDCMAKAENMQSASKNLLTQMKGSGTFTDAQMCPESGGQCFGKKGFITKANDMMRQAMQQSATDFSNRVAMAQARLSGLKSTLGKWGLNLSLADKKNRMNAEDACPKSESEICPLPKDFDTLLGDLSGLPAVDAGQFDEVAGKADEKKEKSKVALEDVEPKIKNLKKLEGECSKEKDVAALKKKVKSKMGEIDKLIAKCKRKARAGGQTDPVVDKKVGDLVDAVTDLCADAPSGSEIEGCSDISQIEDVGNDECLAIYQEKQQQDAFRAIASQRQSQGPAQVGK